MMTISAALLLAALAQTPPVLTPDEPLARAAEASVDRGAAPPVEVAIAVGSGQAYGHLGRDLPTLSDMGWAFDASAGWRFDRSWLLGAYGSGGAFDSLGARAISYDAAAGLLVRRHFPRPEGYAAWVGLGLGWRGHWGSPTGKRDSHQGLDLARLQLGFESRVSPSLTLSPVLGVALTTYLWQRSASDPEYSAVRGPRLSASLFAGLQARFELLGGGAR
jgi:hypothetical protein